MKHIAKFAKKALLTELSLYPKPGLVSYIDKGSHADMDSAMLARSAEVLEPFFGKIASSAASGSSFQELRKIGVDAEYEMLKATGGVNTHRGAIFTLGLFCAAEGIKKSHPADSKLTSGEIVRLRWGSEILASEQEGGGTHGALASRRYGVSGARGEAAKGFPSVYNTALPTLETAIKRSKTFEVALVQTFFSLLTVVEDTNILHRGGEDAVKFVRKSAESFLGAGGIYGTNWFGRAEDIHLDFVTRNLSPGGAADLLAAVIFIAKSEGKSWAR